MCGIIGYVGENFALDYLISGLKRLEYRGYDSAGISVFSNQKFEVIKSEGKLENIEKKLNENPVNGKIGIGHTRWATHGKPNEINAHPHRTGSTVIVHNGIIENYEVLKQEVEKKGYKIISETDSEIFGFLVEDYVQNLKKLNFPKNYLFEEAVRLAFLRLEGSCSIVAVHDEFSDKIVAIKNGTPLVVGFSNKAKGSFVASDAQAIFEHTQDVIFLENYDLVVCTKNEFTIYSSTVPVLESTPLKRKPVHLDWSLESLDKAGFEHYMLKEIFEQPRAILDTLDSLVDRHTSMMKLDGLEKILQNVKRIHIVACGTAYHAGLVGKYVIEQNALVPVEVDIASEYRYRKPIIEEGTLFLAISQSGETADTLAALREAKKLGAKTLSICNVRGSTISRESDYTIFTHAGPEIGVASTKAFTTQVLVLMLLSQILSKKSKELNFDLHFYLKLPHLIQEVLSKSEKIKEVAKKYLSSSGFFYMARGFLYPIALEGALKMKEITYIHAEGYASGELKHGPIAMIDSNITVVAFAPKDSLYEKTISNMQEVKARGAKLLCVGNHNDDVAIKISNHFFGFKLMNDFSDLFPITVFCQLLAYHTAVLKGTDVDKPRNLAKSVTVE